MLISLFIVVVAALVIPLLMARFRVTQVPTAVAEISTGIILGQSGFNVLHGTIRVNFLSNIGVMMLLFLSGMEIDFALFRNKAKKGPDPVKISLLAFGATTVMSIILGLALKLMGLFSDLALAAIILANRVLRRRHCGPDRKGDLEQTHRPDDPADCLFGGGRATDRPDHLFGPAFG